ncbi:hypothetical protein ASG43_06215 [Aureimonas sp. Leaf454]|nr:hypothetical protein ASG43_06215 [Aureimonas sp. Leaf454]
MPDQEPDGSERRVAQRTRTLKRAKILFNNRFSTFDCIVRNISSTGALLTIDDAAHLPKVFEVRIGDEAERPAKLVYRRGMLAGIRFLDVISEEEEQAALDQAALAAETGRASEFGPGDPFHDQASMPATTGLSIRRIVPEALPSALTRRFPWF